MSQILFDEHSERGMLGCIATAPDVIDEFALTAEYFLNPAHHVAFSAMKALQSSGRLITLHSLLGALTAPVVANLGGIHTIQGMLDYVPRGAAPTLYAELSKYVMLRRSTNVLRWAESELHGFLADGGMETFARELARRATGIEVIGDSENLLPTVTQSIEDKLGRMDRGENREGFQTFLPEWNRAFGGICEGQYIAIAGRPATGKTSLLEQLVEDHMDAGKSVVVFEKDMAPQKLIERIACRKSGISYRRFQRNSLGPTEIGLIRKWVAHIRKTGLIRLYAPAGLTADKMCSIVRREVRQSNASCVFLDHITGLSVGKDFRQGLTMASLAIRNNVTETNIPHIILAHINRDGTTGRPSPNNIKEFDQLYGDVDGMAILWSEKEMVDDHKEIFFYAAKNREGGETQEALRFNGPMMKFIVPQAELL